MFRATTKKGIKEKARRKLTRDVLFLHDNAAVHQSGITPAALHEVDFDILNRRPDLAPCDYYLIPNGQGVENLSLMLKSWMQFRCILDLKRIQFLMRA